MKMVGMVDSPLLSRFKKRVCLYCPTVFLSSTWTTGPFPLIKQEQLSPHSLSSQADMSTQQAPHDSAPGRGR